MRRASRIFARGPASFEANMTPLIDMAFLLIVFFVLVSQVAGAEFAELALPRPASGAAARPDGAQRVVVNVLPGEGAAASAYLLGGRRFEPTEAGLAALVDALAEAMRGRPGTEVNVRADRGTAYAWVRPAMDAVADALARSGADRARTRVRLVVLGRPPDA